jgi:hypothetical protein
MEIFLIFALTISTVVFFLKWRRAAEANPQGARRENDPGADRVFLALMRLERKMDALALGGPRPPPADISHPQVPTKPV